MFQGQVDSAKRLDILYNDVERHHVITNLTGTMAKEYCVKGKTMHVKVTFSTSATRRIATVWPALRARSPTIESPATTAIGILEANVS